MEDIKAIIRKMRHLADLAANVADRIDGHNVTIHRGQAVKVKSVEQPHEINTLTAPQNTAAIPVARLSGVCRDFASAIRSGVEALPKDMRA
jgi:hypothetical protein